MTTALNGSLYTFEMAPLFSILENRILAEFAKRLLNWEDVDGIMTPGGSISIMYGK